MPSFLVSFFLLLLSPRRCRHSIRRTPTPFISSCAGCCRVAKSLQSTISSSTAMRPHSLFAVASFAFYGEVNGKVTGAVFKGEGHLHITPPTAEERHNLSCLQQPRNSTRISTRWCCALPTRRPTELHKASTGKGEPDTLHSIRRAWSSRRLRGSRSAQQLRSALARRRIKPGCGRIFLAAIHGNKDPHLFFILDPMERRRGSGRGCADELERMGRDAFRWHFIAPRNTRTACPTATSTMQPYEF